MKLNYRTRKNAEAVSRLFNKPLDRPDWFKIQGAANGDGEILIYDYIGWPFTDPADLIRSLADMGNVTVRLNSPGGDVFDGMAIFNAFRSHSGAVTVRIEGLAASMASVIAMAGKKVQAYDNAMLMIHNSWTVSAGNQYDLRETADILEKIDGNILNAYHEKSKAGKRELADMMRSETWLTAKEAKEKGFVDAIVDGKGAKAHFDLSIFGNVPDGIEAEREGRELTEREIERALRNAGATVSFAKAFVAGRSGSTSGDLRDVENLKGSIRDIILSLKGGR